MRVEEFANSPRIWAYLESYFHPRGMTRHHSYFSKERTSFYITFFNPDLVRYIKGIREGERLDKAGWRTKEGDSLVMNSFLNPGRLEQIYYIRVSNHLSVKTSFDLDIILEENNFAVFEDRCLI